jgi:hypothetical protein
MASQILVTRDMKFLDLIEAWNVSTDVGYWKGRLARERSKLAKEC